MTKNVKKRARSKQAKNFLRLLRLDPLWNLVHNTPKPRQPSLHEERQQQYRQIWRDAYYDTDFYPGEVVSRGYYDLFDVEHGEVIKNPHRQGSFQRPYTIRQRGGELTL